MNASEEIIARYNKIEREIDDFGRSIGVKRLRPAQSLKVVGMTPDLEGITMSIDAGDGKTAEVPYRAQALFAASVVEIEGVPIPFPRNRAELDAIMDRLDSEGMNAAAKALTKLTAGDGENGLEEAKNSQGTPASDSASGSSKTGSRSTSRSPSTTTR